MDASPSWDPVAGWPYYEEDFLPSGDTRDVQQDDPFDMLKDGANPSLSANTNPPSNITYSPHSSMSPLDSSIASLSNYSVDYFDSIAPSNTSSNVTQNQRAVGNASNDSIWPQQETSGSNGQHNYSHGDYRQAPNQSVGYNLNLDENTDLNYRSWEPDVTEYSSDICNPASYGSILDELNRMDASMLSGGIMPSISPSHSYQGPPQYAKEEEDDERQSMHANSHTSESVGSSEEASLPISPISNDEIAAVASKRTAAKSKPQKKSPSRAKLPHSAVEKRYRSNLNSKLLDLQQCVPTLHEDTEVEEGAGSPDAPASASKKVVKLQKGLILSSAADYIRALSSRTSDLEAQNEHLERRLAVLQKIALQKTKGAGTELENSDRKRQRVSAVTKPISPVSPTVGVSQAPTRVKKSLIGNSEQAGLQKNLQRALTKYGREASNDLIAHDQPSPAKRRKFSRGELAKVAVSSLIGLALWDGYSESEIPDGVPNGRGLLALPAELIRVSMRYLVVSIGGAEPYLHYLTSFDFWGILRVLLLIGAVVYALMPALLAVLHWTGGENRKPAVNRLQSTLPLPVTVEFCRQAWLTAVQSLRIPDRGVMLEIVALAIKTWKLFLRRFFGWQVYSYLTGATLESEIARAKAWDIALDAQLAGGDPNADFLRLLLTFLASMTIEDTPLRLLRKSLHVRLIFWNFSNTRIGQRLGIGSLAKHLGNHFWLNASAMHESVQEPRSGPNDGVELLDVPSHISELMKQGSDAVFVNSVVIRASRVAQNEQWSCPEVTADEGMDAVFDDVTIRSPLDALSALFSSLTLRNALLATFDRKTKRHQPVDDALHLALVTAPPGSRAGTRARAAGAVFLKTNRISSIAAALQELPKQHKSNTASFHFIEPAIASICTTNVRIALRSAALIVGTAGEIPSRYLPNPKTRIDMIRIIESMLHNKDVTILGFATAYRCAVICCADAKLCDAAGPDIRTLLERLRLIADSDWSSRYGVDRASIKFDTAFAQQYRKNHVLR